MVAGHRGSGDRRGTRSVGNGLCCRRDRTIACGLRGYGIGVDGVMCGDCDIIGRHRKISC